MSTILICGYSPGWSSLIKFVAAKVANEMEINFIISNKTIHSKEE